MSVTLYDETRPGPKDFIGYRVRRCVGGKVRQAYLTLRKAGNTFVDAAEEAEIKRQAEALDAQWLAEQRIAAEKRRRAAKPTARASGHSRVRGIYPQTRPEGACWVVRTTEQNARAFYIDDDSENADRSTFAVAVDRLCDARDLDNTTRQNYIARWKPHPALASSMTEVDTQCSSGSISA